MSGTYKMVSMHGFERFAKAMGKFLANIYKIPYVHFLLKYFLNQLSLIMNELRM